MTEQEIRGVFGYADTERRSVAERAEAARRMCVFAEGFPPVDENPAVVLAGLIERHREEEKRVARARFVEASRR